MLHWSNCPFLLLPCSFTTWPKVFSLFAAFTENVMCASPRRMIVHSNSAQSDNNNTLYFKLPYLPFSNFARRKVRTLVKRYCSNLTIKLAFSSFEIKHLIKIKDSVPRSLQSCVVYKFTCVGCTSVYVGETCRHISTRIRE